MKRIAISMLVLALCASFLFAGCSTPTSAYPGTAKKGSITFNLGQEPPKMSSILTTDTVSFTVLRHTMEGLTTLDKDNKVLPGMAESWDVSDDKLTYTFHLRDAKWANGDAVTANDFAFAWMTVLNPDTPAGYNYMLYVIKNGQAYNEGTATAEDVGIKVIDEKTLEVTLEAPTSYFLSQLAFGTFMPVNEAFYNQYGDQYATEASNMLCNGPWILSSWEHESKLVMTKNPDYYGAKDIKIDELVGLMITDSNVAMNTFQSGEADMIGLNGEQREQMKNEGETVQNYSDASSWVFAFNLTDPTLANMNVRKALTLAIDRQKFIDNLLKNDSVAGFNWTPPDIMNVDKVFQTQLPEGGKYFKDADIDGAKAALELAKTELGVDSIKVDLLTDDTDNAKLNAAYYQDCWKAIGVDATVTAVPFKDRLARQDAKDYQVSLYGWGPDYNDAMTFLDLFVSGSGNNIIGLNDAKYDENIQKAMVEADYDTRTQLLIDCENTLIQNYYLGPIYFRMRDYITSAKLDGVLRNGLQDINFRWATVK